MTDIFPCVIRHLDLHAPLPKLEGAGSASLLVFFWLNGRPYGRRLFAAGELPVPASALPAIAATACAPNLGARDDVVPPCHPAGVQGTIDVSNLAWNDVGFEPAPDLPPLPGRTSVIVCTRGRPDDLMRCLASLAGCDPAPHETILVDNNETPADDLRGRIEALPGGRYVHERMPGLSAARNAGVAIATGDYVAFTDDDVEVAPNWLAALLAPLKDPAVGITTGLVLPANLDSDAACTFEFDYGGLQSGLRPWRFDETFLNTAPHKAPAVWLTGAGASMAFRRTVLDEEGPFNLRLGAGAAGCSEDSEYVYRALRSGWECWYTPRAVVHHHHRRDMDALARQMRAYLCGHTCALLSQFARTGQTGNLFRVLFSIPRYLLAQVVRIAIASLGFTPFYPYPARRRRVIGSEILGFLQAPFVWARLQFRPTGTTRGSK